MESEAAVKKKVIIYPKRRDLTFEGIREALSEVQLRVKGASALGNGGWLLRLSRAEEVDAVLAAAKKGELKIGGEKVAAQLPAQAAGVTDANRVPIGGSGGYGLAKLPFKKNRDNKRQRACTVIVARIKPSSADAIKKVVSALGKVGDVKASKGPLTRAEIAEEEISLSQIEGRKVQGESLLNTDGIALVEFAGVAQAFAAVKALHGQVIKGLSRQLWCRQLGGEGAKIKYWRVIIRNLPFKIDEKKLRKHMSLNGSLFAWDIHIPKGADGKVRGFGFAGYICRSDAEKAIKALNGTKLEGRTIVIDWTVGKKEFQEGKAPEEGGPRAMSDEEEEKEEKEGQEAAGGHKARKAGGDADSSGSEDEDGDHDYEGANNQGGAEDDESAMLQRIVSSFQANSSVKEEEEKKKRPERKDASAAGPAAPGAPKASQPREEDDEAINRTVFVTHIPLNAFRIDLQRVMEKFGQVSSCRMVIDKQARKFSGKAFVEYAHGAHAKKAVKAHADAKAGKKEAVSVNGHNVNVYLALNRNGIQGLSDMIKLKTNRPDKRNLYLTDEGYIAPNSTAAEGMSDGDMQARERSHREKLEKLKNPNMFVSMTRLMIRNLPADMTKGQLRVLCTKAIRERATQARPKIVQCKILYADQGNRKVLKSSERGFIEFTDHEHAICCLRMLNNNPEVFTPQRRPIVEFAVENALKAKLSKQKMSENALKGKANNVKRRGDERDPKAASAPAKDAKKKARGAEEEEGGRREKGGDSKKQDRQGKGRARDARDGGEEPKEKREREGKKGKGAREEKKKRKERPAPAAAGEEAKPSRSERERPAKRERRARKKSKSEGGDKLDNLIENYQSKYFDPSQQKDLKGWFD